MPVEPQPVVGPVVITAFVPRSPGAWVNPLASCCVVPGMRATEVIVSFAGCTRYDVPSNGPSIGSHRPPPSVLNSRSEP
jgi:hypothetical protein